MKIAIIGSGAMGSLFGGRLARGGHDVVLYDINQAHVDHVNHQGLEIEEIFSGESYTVRPGATTAPEETADAQVMIIFVKSTATEAVAAQFAKLAEKETLVITLQNGVGNEDILKKHFGAHRTAAGVTSQGATFAGSGKIRHAGNGPTYLCMSDGDNRRLAPFLKALNESGFETHIEENIADLVWSKLIINVGINAVTALTGLENGKITGYQGLRQIMDDMVKEALKVAEAKNIRISHDDPLQTVFDVCEKTGPNRSSMLQDFDRGSLTEIDFINNAIVREGEALGIPTPVNRTVSRLIKSIEIINREAAK